MTLEQQYKQYLKVNPDSKFTYTEWLEWFLNRLSDAFEKLHLKPESEDDMNGYELPYSLKYCVTLIARELNERSIWYEGDVSDLGNEIGYVVGNVLKDMTETEMNDFVHGIRHGISLTNGTH